jgi:hypothetical protein
MAAVIPPPGGSVTRTPGTSAKKSTEEVRRSYIFISLRRKDFHSRRRERQMPAETLPKVADGQVVDYLDEDSEIPTQRYCIMSFLSPEKVIQNKDRFFFKEFVQFMNYDWKVKGLEHFMAFLAKKYDLKIDDLLKDAEEFGKVRDAEIRATDVEEQWQVFLLKHEKETQEKYDQSVDFRTNVRGVKLRRVFGNVEEAQVMAKVFQRKYPKDNIYIGKVGCWLPWDPSEHLMPEVEYAEKELNELMRKYKENESNKEIFFAEQRQEAVKKQKEENARRSNAGARQLEDAAKPVHPTEGAIRE